MFPSSLHCHPNSASHCHGFNRIMVYTKHAVFHKKIRLTNLLSVMEDLLVIAFGIYIFWLVCNNTAQYTTKIHGLCVVTFFPASTIFARVAILLTPFILHINKFWLFTVLMAVDFLFASQTTADKYSPQKKMFQSSQPK